MGVLFGFSIVEKCLLQNDHIMDFFHLVLPNIIVKSNENNYIMGTVVHFSPAKQTA